MKIEKTQKTYLIWLVLLLPIGIHFYLLNQFSLNFPFEDDHRIFLDFTYNYIHTNSFLEKVRMFFTPENESRPFLLRLSILGELSLFKALNFHQILIYFNVYTLIMLGVFMLKYRTQPLLLVSISFGLLSLCGWEMYFRNDVASYHLPTITFSLLAFYLVTSSEKLTPILSLIFAICFLAAPFGSGIGFLAVLLITIYTYFRKSRRQLFYIIFLVLIQIILYKFIGSEDSSEKGFLDNLFKYKLEIVWAFFIAIGGQFQLFSNSLGIHFSGVLGLLILFLAGWFILKKWSSKLYDFEKLTFFFALGSLAVIVLSRYNYWLLGYESILVPRYKLYGIIVFIIALTFVFRELQSKVTKIAINSVMILLYVLWMMKTLNILDLKNETQMMDAINLENGVLKPDNKIFIAPHKYKFLTENRYFDSSQLRSEVKNKLKNGKVIYPQKAIIKVVSYDPAFGADWGGKKTMRSKVEITGDFPVAKTYFIELVDNKGKKLLLNGYRKPVSVIKRILFPAQRIDYLSKELEMDFYTLEKPLTCRVICINPVKSTSK